MPELSKIASAGQPMHLIHRGVAWPITAHRVDRRYVEPGDGLHEDQSGVRPFYAARFAERFRGVPGHPFGHGFDLTLRPERLDQPLRWRTRRMIFVNSMSDLFHKQVTNGVH